MESQTYIRNIRISAKKLRFLTNDIKKRRPMEALHYLNYTPKRGARLFYKAVKSAMANARAKLKTGDDALRFKLLAVEQGPKLKRYRAGGRGAAKPIQRRSAHIKIILTSAKPAEKTPSSKETEPTKKTVKKEVKKK